jgi:hypothetical protein
MKKILLSAMLVGLAVGVYAQGQINLGNLSNAGNTPDANATTGGLFFINAGSGPVPINTDFNVSFYGGSDANNLSLLKTLVASGGGAAGGPGTFLDLSGVPVSIPGALTSGFFRIDAWVNAATFDTASAKGTTGPTAFANPLGNPNAQPPGTPTDFTAMPALVITVPEPSTFALAGLGAAALLIFRRRK